MTRPTTPSSSPSRHQSALIKIGRDKQVKWISWLARRLEGRLRQEGLKPSTRTASGSPVKARPAKGDFDCCGPQHTGWRVDSKSDKKIFYPLGFRQRLTARGTATARAAFPEMKHSCAVVYKIDQKKMTVENRSRQTAKQTGPTNGTAPSLNRLTEYHER